MKIFQNVNKLPYITHIIETHGIFFFNIMKSKKFSHEDTLVRKEMNMNRLWAEYKYTITIRLRLDFIYTFVLTDLDFKKIP